MNWRYKLMQFMSGRYGQDNLFYILFGVSMVLSFINIFFRSLILQTVVYALIIYAVLRFFSRNIEARRRENYWIRNKLNFFKSKKEFYDRKKADKLHIYKKCNRCGAVLRLPRRVGKHKTVCPKCGAELTVRVRK